MKSIILACASFVSIGFACVHQKPAAYAAELARCTELSRSCKEYVDCRLSVAEHFHREFSGSCIVDGGQDE